MNKDRFSDRRLAQISSLKELRIGGCLPTHLFGTEESGVEFPSLRVLEPISEEEAQGRGLIRLCLPAVEEAISGRVLRFADERYNELIAQITTATLSCNLRQRITVIDLRRLHALQMICDGQYLLKLGEVAEIDMKLKVANAVMADTLFCSSVKAQIDLTLSGETSVVLDNQLDLDW